MSPAACPSCVFGAATTSLISYQLHAIQTITVSVIPHVTVYTNGTEKTSFERITETNTDFVGSGSDTSVPQTFTNKDDITWTVGDATLTYPTTYVQYLGFEGATASSGASATCAEPTDATEVELPESTSCAPFIYPWDSVTTGAMALPTPLLEYLAQLPIVSSQFNGEQLTSCAPLTWTPPASVSASATGYTMSSLHSSISATTSSEVSAPVPQTTLPSSWSLYSPPAESSQSTGNYSIPLSSRTLGTEPPHAETTTTGADSTATTHPVPVTTGNPLPPTSTSIIYGEGSSEAVSEPYYSGSSPPVYQTTASVGTQTHTTAFVIEPITGPTTYTTISGPHGDHTTKPHQGPGKSTKKSNDNQHHTGGHTGGSPGASPHHTGTRKPGAPGSPVDNGNGGHHHTGPAVYTNGGHSITAKSGGGVVIGSQTVRPGHKITIGSGSHKTEVALQTDHGRTRLNIGGTIYSVKPQHAKVTPGPGGEASVSVGVITTNGHKITAVRSGNSVVLVDGRSRTTVRAGEQVTFDGEKISVPQRPGSIAVNGHSVQLTAGDNAQATVTAGGHTFTAVDVGKSVMLKDESSTVLVKDGARTMFEGQTISVPVHGSAVVVNGKTTSFSTTKTTTGVGGYITHGLGGTHGAATPSATVLPVTGAASPIRSMDVLSMLSVSVLALMTVIAIL